MRSHKQQVNARYKQPLNKSNTLLHLSKLTKIKKQTLQTVYNRGVGAWHTNIRSVRTKKTFKKNQDLPRSRKLSKEQWAMARVYAFINKIKSKKKLNHDTDLV